MDEPAQNPFVAFGRPGRECYQTSRSLGFQVRRVLWCPLRKPRLVSAGREREDNGMH